MEKQAVAAGRNPYFEGQHPAEEPADTADRLALVAERDRLRELADSEGSRAVEYLRRARKAEAEAAKSERRAITFGDILSQNISAMRAAVVAGHLESHAHGLQWIVNTLAGPGHLPDLDEARMLGGAQALFDKEMAEHEAFRAAHPAP